MLFLLKFEYTVVDSDGRSNMRLSFYYPPKLV